MSSHLGQIRAVTEASVDDTVVGHLHIEPLRFGGVLSVVAIALHFGVVRQDHKGLVFSAGTTADVQTINSSDFVGAAQRQVFLLGGFSGCDLLGRVLGRGGACTGLLCSRGTTVALPSSLFTRAAMSGR